MKRKQISVGIASVLLLLATCASVSSAPQPEAGGYAKAAITDDKIVSAAAFAIDAEKKAMQARGESATLELVNILGAEQQVVAGINYRLTLKVKRNGQEQSAKAVVWWQAWRQPDPYRLTSWEWK